MLHLNFHRTLLLVALAGAAALSACVPQQKDQRLSNYEKSIREEADWLWNNMNYVRTNLYPDEAHCQPQVYDHPRVELSDYERQNLPRTVALVEQLDYAAVVIQQAHDEWTRFCQRQSSASITASALETRLMVAYEYMNGVRIALIPDKDTPQPGST